MMVHANDWCKLWKNGLEVFLRLHKSCTSKQEFQRESLYSISRQFGALFDNSKGKEGSRKCKSSLWVCTDQAPRR